MVFYDLLKSLSEDEHILIRCENGSLFDDQVKKLCLDDYSGLPNVSISHISSFTFEVEGDSFSGIEILLDYKINLERS